MKPLGPEPEDDGPAKALSYLFALLVVILIFVLAAHNCSP